MPDCVNIIRYLCRYSIETVKILNESNSNDTSVNDSSANLSGASNDTLGDSSTTKKRRESKRRSANANDTQDGEKEDQSGETEEVPVSVTLTGIVEALYLMFTAMSEQLEENEDRSVREGIAKKLCITVRELMSFSQVSLFHGAHEFLTGQFISGSS